MKKSTIGIVVVAVIMVIAGIGLCIGGVIAAGGVGAAKDEIFKSGIDLSHVYTFEKDEDGWDIDFDRGNHETEHHSAEITQSTNVNPGVSGNEIISGLELEIGAAKVEFVTNSSIDEIGVQTNDDFDVYVRNRVLHIKTRNVVNDNTIILEIPQNVVFENVEIQGNACEIEIPYIETKKFDIEADAGFVLIEELIAEQAEFEIGVGEIVVNSGNVLGCDVNVDMGNFEYHGVVTKHGDVECGMGNAELYLNAKENDYDYEIECAAGNVTIGNENYSGLSVGKKVNNNAGAVIEVDCSVGNVTIGF